MSNVLRAVSALRPGDRVVLVYATGTFVKRIDYIGHRRTDYTLYVYFDDGDCILVRAHDNVTVFDPRVVDVDEENDHNGWNDGSALY